MKTAEQIQDMIDYNQEEINDCKVSLDKEKEILSKRLSEGYSPEYIAKWLPTWMETGMNYYASRIAKIEEENRILKWVLKG